MALRLHRIISPSVRFTAPEGDGERHLIWIQATTEGRWKGHPAHKLVEFTEQVLKQIITNFRANPSFLAGDGGFGERPVVRLDYEHLSELDPRDLPKAQEEGIPAPGWIYDLELRDGSGPNEGKLELWALVLPGEKLWQQIKNEEYIWTSVAVDPEGRDRETNEPIGAVLTSLAITNNPFILGMEPMSVESTESQRSTRVAASMVAQCVLVDVKKRGRSARVHFAMEMWGEAETPEEALVGIRNVFNLPAEATAAESLLELNKFSELVATDTVPKHVDAEYVCSRLRTIFSLRLLSDWNEVIDAARKALACLIEKDVPGGGNVPSAGQSPLDTGTNSENNMSARTLTTRLTAALNLPTDADDDAVVDTLRTKLAASAAFKARIRKVLCRINLKKAKLAESEEDDAKIVDALEEAAEVAEVAEKAEEAANALEELIEILDADNLTEVLSKATKLVDDAKKHGPMVEELNALKARLADGEIKEAEDEIEAIAATYSVDARTKKLLTSLVLKEETVDGKTVRILNAAGLETLRKDWPLKADQQRALLTKRVLAGAGGTQYGGAGTNAALPPEGHDSDANLVKEAKEKIAFCAGRNEIEKAVSYLSGEKSGFDGLPRGDQIRIAGTFVRTGKIVA